MSKLENFSYFLMSSGIIIMVGGPLFLDNIIFGLIGFGMVCAMVPCLIIDRKRQSQRSV